MLDFTVTSYFAIESSGDTNPAGAIRLKQNISIQKHKSEVHELFNKGQ